MGKEGNVKSLRVMTIFGTRPEAVKMCPLVLAMKREPRIQVCCCVTGQHRELLRQGLAPFGVTPDIDLNVMQPHQSLSQLTAACLQGLEPVLRAERPDLVLVHGDTTTALSGALAAFYQGIPVGHVEAGLRSGQLDTPFPEEGNRRLIDQLSTLRFCPTQDNLQNLIREGLTQHNLVTGNTGVDALAYFKEDGWDTPALAALEEKGKPVVTITCHRRENAGAPLRQVISAVHRLAAEFPQWTLVWPVHPTVAEVVTGSLSHLKNVLVLPPLGVGEMHRLVRLSAFLLTDSGGLQEEGAALGTPTLLLRQTTERPEGMKSGLAQLVGIQEEEIFQAAKERMEEPERRFTLSAVTNPYGDGHACDRIVSAILDWFSGSGKPGQEH
jgi:UDP-N-acetylglucosamine 2-epimerase (non-hydrolysing)